jgi:hypothetical protein
LFASRRSPSITTQAGRHRRDTRTANFNPNHPIYRRWPAWRGSGRRSGAAPRRNRWSAPDGDTPGPVATPARPSGGGETLVAFNTGTTPISANVAVDAGTAAWTALHGRCAPSSTAPGSVRVEIAPLDYIVCKGSVR